MEPKGARLYIVAHAFNKQVSTWVLENKNDRRFADDDQP